MPEITFTATLSGWMHRRSWAIAMTVAIVITVGGLVILETARQRIATEYEAALEARGVTVQLSVLASELALLDAHESAFRLTKQEASASQYCATAAQARRRYSSNGHSPLLPVWRVTTRSRLGTNAINWPPEPGLCRASAGIPRPLRPPSPVMRAGNSQA